MAGGRDPAAPSARSSAASGSARPKSPAAVRRVMLIVAVPPFAEVLNRNRSATSGRSGRRRRVGKELFRDEIHLALRWFDGLSLTYLDRAFRRYRSRSRNPPWLPRDGLEMPPACFNPFTLPEKPSRPAEGCPWPAGGPGVAPPLGEGRIRCGCRQTRRLVPRFDSRAVG